MAKETTKASTQTATPAASTDDGGPCPSANKSLQTSAKPDAPTEQVLPAGNAYPKQGGAYSVG